MRIKHYDVTYGNVSIDDYYGISNIQSMTEWKIGCIISSLHPPGIVSNVNVWAMNHTRGEDGSDVLPTDNEEKCGKQDEFQDQISEYEEGDITLEALLFE